MPYPDIEISADGTTWKDDGNGDFETVNRDVDIAADVLLTDIGGFKYAPLVGGAAKRYLNSSSQAAIIERNFKVALKAAGFKKPIVDVSNFPPEIGVNDDVILV